MFLIKAFFTFSFLFATQSYASQSAAPMALPGVEAGNYALVEGNAKLCTPYRLSETDLQSPKITVGGRYPLLLKNARKQIESDLDVNCDFIEESTKEPMGAETVVTRMNSEVCGGTVVKSKITSKFTFRGAQVVLEHSIQEDTRQAGYRCVWGRIN